MLVLPPVQVLVDVQGLRGGPSQYGPGVWAVLATVPHRSWHRTSWPDILLLTPRGAQPMILLRGGEPCGRGCGRGQSMEAAGSNWGHEPPLPAGTSRTPGDAVPKSRSHAAWLRGSGTCRGGRTEKAVLRAPAGLGRGTPVSAATPLKGPRFPPPGLRETRARLLHLVQVVGAAMVDVVAQAGRDHGEGLQVRVVALQLSRLRGQAPGPAAPPAPSPALLPQPPRVGAAGPGLLPLR